MENEVIHRCTFEEIIQNPDPRLACNAPLFEDTRSYINKRACYRVHQSLLHDYKELFGEVETIELNGKMPITTPEKLTARMLGPLGCHVSQTPRGPEISYRHVNIESLACDADEFFEFIRKLWKSIFLVVSSNFYFNTMRDVGNISSTVFYRVLVMINYHYRGVIRYALLHTPGFYEKFDEFFNGEYGLSRHEPELISYEYVMYVPEAIKVTEAIFGPNSFMRRYYNKEQYEKDKKSLESDMKAFEERYTKKGDKNPLVRLGKFISKFISEDDEPDKDLFE